MYYTLAPYVSLVGFLRLPYGLFDMRRGQTSFYTKSQYDLIRQCDGEHSWDHEALPEPDRDFFVSLCEKGLIQSHEEPTPLKEYQKYIYYENRFKDHIQWSVTGLCNYRCRHCFMSAPDAKFGQLSLDECRVIADGMAESGVRMVSLTGGEPLVRSDLFEIIDMLLRRHILVSTIFTNGALLDRAFMEKLVARRLRPMFQLSFDGLHCHDWMRGIEGAEEEVVRAFELIREYGMSFGVSMVLHRHNVDTIGETVRFLAEKGCSYIKLGIAEPCGNWASQSEHFLTMPEMFRAFLDYIPEFVRDGKPVSVMFGGAFQYDKEEDRFLIPYDKGGCSSYEKAPVCTCIRTEAYISPEGCLLPCMTMVGGKIAESFPNVLETPLPELLRDSHYTDMMSLNVGDYTAHNEACAQCPYISHCHGGCRAIAVGETGTDLFGADPEACTFYRGGWFRRFSDLLAQCTGGM